LAGQSRQAVAAEIRGKTMRIERRYTKEGQSAGNGIDHSAVPFNEILQVDLVLK